MELKCHIQTYEWGKLGPESKVATLFKVNNPEFEIDPNTPYAELWMGTHINGPAVDKATGERLSVIISNHPEYLGEPIRQKFGDQLPFLFKVLSVNKALSIQAHPSKKYAEELHQQHPEIYKDPNHKPELTIALTPFVALCGFKPISEVQIHMRNVRELRAIVGTSLAEQFMFCDDPGASKRLLQQCFESMMACPPDQVRAQLAQMLVKFSNIEEGERTLQLAALVEQLHSQFPGDVGCFAVYFLNLVELKPHEALYLGPNEPHAYLSGDCVECMACSDNVVRAGLTPKYKDVVTLCSILSYNSQPVEEKIFKPIKESEYCELFAPPVPDFAVVKIIVPKGESYYKLPPRNSASILLVVSGTAAHKSMQLKYGSVLFIPANDKIEITNVNQDLLMFQAMANV